MWEVKKDRNNSDHRGSSTESDAIFNERKLNRKWPTLFDSTTDIPLNLFQRNRVETWNEYFKTLTTAQNFSSSKGVIIIIIIVLTTFSNSK